MSKPASPSPKKTHVPVVDNPRTSNAPAKGVIERYHYDDKEKAKILAALPGKGSVIKTTFQTALGDIHCQLELQAAPQTVTNFLALALGIRKWRDPDTGDLLNTPYYEGMNFHRTIENFIIQTGNPGAKSSGGPGWKLEREKGKPDLYGQAGVMGMVDKGDDTHGGQFFITLKPAKNLASKYTAFGHCEDLKLVRTIANAKKYPSEKEGKSPTKPKKPVRLLKVLVHREQGPAGHQEAKSSEHSAPLSTPRKTAIPSESGSPKPAKTGTGKKTPR